MKPIIVIVGYFIQVPLKGEIKDQLNTLIYTVLILRKENKNRKNKNIPDFR